MLARDVAPRDIRLEHVLVRNRSAMKAPQFPFVPCAMIARDEEQYRPGTYEGRPYEAGFAKAPLIVFVRRWTSHEARSRLRTRWDSGYNAGMMNRRSPNRLLALMLVVVLGVSLAAPARAEALGPLVVVAIAGAAVVVVILVVYLIVANVRDSRTAKEAESVMVMCAESDGQPRNCSALSRSGQRGELESALLTPQG